ncbi:MAG TPA: ATP-binding cassette domain-containing protein [Actinocrinis sp.]|nr:ATP-binding cassette domain-containing protein [Actinocrinis sp.]HXR70897.1 ATP-binding cassette domain-containing protein [Actinocrinis sp.]
MTGFLGPNGAGKSTTMRMVIGLDAPTSGSVVVNGCRYDKHSAPLQEVGALLEAKSIHPGRSAFNHLNAPALTHGIARRRVQEVIELAGLQSIARKRAGAFSLGMGQRLGIASGLTNSEIATRLLLSESTIKTHVSKVLAKIGARDRVHAVIIAYEAGLVRPDQTR